MWNWVKSQFKQRWHPSEDLYQIAFSTFLFTAGLVVALRLAGVEGVAVNIFSILLIIVAVIAILTSLRIKMEPKDTRLDTLIKQIKTTNRLIRKMVKDMKEK